MSGGPVLVTGSTSGIGWASARRLRAAGRDVILNGRTDDGVDAAVARLNAADVGDAGRAGTVTGVAADLHSPTGASDLAAALAERHESLDGLVISHGGPQVPEIFATSDPATFTQLAEVALLTNARLMHALLPLLRRSKGGARVVLVTSDAARYPTTGEVLIGALAAANLMMVRTMARELARDRVRINAVTVSLTHDTRTHDRVTEASDFSRRLFEKAASLTPFGPVRADDVAATVVHLVGDAADTVTGQVVGVTGGLST